MHYGYIRVSSDKQTVENQRYEILSFCKKHDIRITGWIEETISGTVSPQKRRLGKLIRKVKKGDVIICAEMSRLGRSLFMIMDVLSYCMKKGCLVWTIKDNYRLGEDIQSKILAFAFGLAAEIERNLISQRTKEALARRKATGTVLGRPRGKVVQQGLKLFKYHDYISDCLQKKIPKTRIARECEVNYKTMLSYIDTYMKTDDTLTNQDNQG